MRMLFRLSFFIILFHQAIFCDQDIQEKMLCPIFDSDVQIVENKYVGEGFLQGTLVKTIDGYVTIEQIEVGDVLVGLEGVQEVLSVKKGKVNRYVRLLIDGKYVCAAQRLYFYEQHFN